MNLNYRFKPTKAMTFLALIAFIFLISLGCWQLDRGGQKKQILLAQKERAKASPLVWKADMAKPLAFQPLQLTGQYLPQVFFLDNQHDDHRFGYHVLSPLLLTEGRVVIVDRGFIAGLPDRRELPSVDVPTGALTLTGSAYYPAKNQWVLGEAIEKRGPKYVVLEKLDTKLISQTLHKSIYPFIIRLGKNDPNGFLRHWAIVSMPPERHYAYALQWFAMALVLLLIYIGLNLKKVNENS